METFSGAPTSRPKKRDRTREILELASGQAGTVSFAQLLELGLSAEAVKRRVDNFELTPRSRPTAQHRVLVDGRLRPFAAKDPSGEPYLTSGAYSVLPGRQLIDSTRWAALLGGPPDAHLARMSAAAALDLDRQRGRHIHVVSTTTGWRAPKGVQAHVTDRLPEPDRTRVNGAACTSAARTLLDTAGRIPTEKLDDLVDRAIEIKIYDELDLRRVIEDWNTTPNAVALAEALGRVDEKSGDFRSVFERRTTRLVEKSTVLPPPVVNVLVHGFRPDIHFPGTRAILECDGQDYHRSLAQVAADEAREELLHAYGFVIRRLRWGQVRYEPERTLDLIERFVLANLEPPVPRG